MIKEYYRPKSLNEASEIIKKNPLAIPIGGGTSINSDDRDIAIVDLQDLDLKSINKDGDKFIIGSGTTLDQIENFFSKNNHLVRALKIEGSKNQRNLASIAGLIKQATGRSPMLTCLLTLDAQVLFASEEIGMPLSEFLKIRNSNRKLISQLIIDNPDGLLFESVSRSPLDLPIVCCALYEKENVTRGAVGGFGNSPIIVPVENFIENNHGHISKYIDFADDEWASAEYRSTVSQIILNRLVESSKKGNH